MATKNVCCHYCHCSFNCVVVVVVFSIRNTKGYLCTNEKDLVEREKLMIKAKINNKARRKEEEARGTEYCVISIILC